MRPSLYTAVGSSQPTTYCSVASPSGCQRAMAESASLTPAVVVSQTTAPDNVLLVAMLANAMS